jgi:hypothetical protein
MSKNKPTQSQIQILELLSAFEYLTTHEVCEYLAGRVKPATKRAVEQRLQLLHKHGFIGAELLSPVRGAASGRRWSLLRKGSAAIRVTHEPIPTTGPQGVCARRGVTPREAAVLRLLLDMKHLTTKQIRSHLHSDRPKRYTWRLLSVLRELGYLQGRRMYPEMGAASECYWTIRKAGASAIGAPYDRRYLRRPARRTIEHRGLLLEMSRQVQSAGWSLIKPAAHSRGRGRAEGGSGDLPGGNNSSVEASSVHTPQRARLVEAVLYGEAAAIRHLVEQGYSVADLRDRIERLMAGQVGAVVPRAPNEYVAYVPGRPELTAVLIPHPTWAGRAFWARRPGVARSNRAQSITVRAMGHSGPRTRVERYARLAKVVPVIAVFGTEEASGQYAPLLAGSGFHRVAVEDVTEMLVSLMGSASGDSRKEEAPGHEAEVQGLRTEMQAASSST